MRAISFDVFDTVLTRTFAEPRDVFVRVGERLAADLPTTLPPMTFAAARCEAERNARHRAPAHEVRLDDIYAELAAQLGWDDAQRDAAKTLELAVETECIRPVPAMRAEVERARREAGRVLFISDMYLPSEVIQLWLDKAGFWQPGDRLFISWEAGGSKSTGVLFEKIRRDLGLDFAAWTHHGDHPVSDFTRPGGLGMATRHQPAGRLNPREQLLRGSAQFATGWRSLLAGAARLARLDQPAATAGNPQACVLWETGVDVAGPWFYGFTEWCLAEAERRGIEDLFFLARGGQVFLRLAREIQAVRPRNLRVHYLPVSRLAVIGSADTDNPARLRALAASRLSFHSARQACANLGLVLDETLAPAWLPPAEWDRNLTGPERTRLADWLLDPVRLPIAQAALRARQNRTHTYLHQLGLSAGAICGIVDTGWMGTIQHNLEATLGATGAPTALTGFYLGLSQQLDLASAGPRLAYGTLLSRSPVQRVQTQRVLVELMTRADHGSVVGYAYTGEGAGVLTPQFGPLDAAAGAQARFFQDAVVAFTRHALAAGPQFYAAPAGELLRVIEGVFAKYYERPTAAEVRVFGRLPHSDQLLEKNFSVLCPDLRPGETLAALFDRRRRPDCWWIEGQATLGMGTWLHFYMALKKIKWWLQSAPARGTG